MKKILAVVTMAAMVASAAFAVDLSAMIQLDGKVVAYDGAFKAVELNKYDPAHGSDFVWKLAGAGDQAGGEIDCWALDGSVSQWNIWLKPVDAVKVNVGHLNYATSAPHFGWWAKLVDWDGYGYSADISAGAVSANIGLKANADYWFAGAGVGDFIINGSYNLGSAGSIQALFAKGARVGAHGFGANPWGGQPYEFAIAYSNQPWAQTGYFADVAVCFTDAFAFDRVNAQIYVEYHTGALAAMLINQIQYTAAGSFLYGFEAKATYAVGGYTPFLQIVGYDIMKTPLAMTITPGVDFSVGGCSIDVAANIGIGASTTFDLAIQFTINL